MVVAGFRHRSPRDDAHVYDVRLAVNELIRQPRQHADVRLLLRKVILAVLESSGDFRRKREPSFDLKARRGGDGSLKDCVGKPRVLTFPNA